MEQINDWIKIRENKKSILWKHKKFKKPIEIVTSQLINLNTSKKHTIYFLYIGVKSEGRTFFIKKEAIEYAFKYMKKHPIKNY